MGYDLTKRLSYLKAQTEADSEGRYSLLGILLPAFLALATLAFFVSQLAAPTITVDEPQSLSEPRQFSKWQSETKILVGERRDYLLDSMLFGETRAVMYVRFAKNVINLFGVGEPNDISDKGKVLNFESWAYWITEATAGIFLRAAFLIFACLHYWLLAIVVGVVIFRQKLIPKRTRDFLGVLDRKRGPFYSGIFAPLRPNLSTSATELSAPGLACPNLAPKKEALDHPLVKILTKFDALNDTNLELVRIILAYRDYPTIVDEERVVEEGEDNATPTTSFRTNEEGTIEKCATESLLALFQALATLKRHYAGQDKIDESHFAKDRALLSQRITKLSPLTAKLVTALTPSRGLALAQLSTAAVASAYLATEAGKYLVYRREGDVFFPISRFPHLQARAVLHSITSYHQEYCADLRMIVRQAIISSRRHGDFGRAFLPVHMPMASRALRDWLEVLFSAPKRREGFAHLVELDSHLEEIHLSFRKELIKRLVSEGMRIRRDGDDLSHLQSQLWKGFAYKSVVLFPLKEMVEVALRQIDSERLHRVTHLMQITKKLQASLSISARLPGFKRQAEVAEKSALESGGITRAIAEAHQDAPLLAGWLILRRLLTRYNWLSTRVGDCAVPPDGLIQAVVLDRTYGERPEVVGLDALVPLRQRRFKELLGAKWETQFYAHSPSSNDIDIYEESEEYQEGMKEIREQVVKGLFDRKKGAMKV